MSYDYLDEQEEIEDSFIRWKLKKEKITLVDTLNFMHGLEKRIIELDNAHSEILFKQIKMEKRIKELEGRTG